MPALSDIVHAQRRIAAHLQPTPLEIAPGLAPNIYLKLENANKTHSFKIRGALNAILSLDDSAREHGIIAASSGNHAQGVAYAANSAGIRAQILMPEHTPQRKVNGVKQWGADAILYGANYDETEAEALRRSRDEQIAFVSPYNDPHIIAGAGTIGLEIIAQLPQVERVIVPVSGGGLISGVALAIKYMQPHAEVIGVNAESAPSMYNHFHNTQKIEVWETLAEALSGAVEVGSITIPITLEYVDNIVTVTEAQIADAMRWMVTTQGWIAEGGGVVGVAALLNNIIPVDDRPTVVVISGGNIDAETLKDVLCG
ncbi:MAG: threonine ammonia-lyase [Aggregatilineales bacterium]